MKKLTNRNQVEKPMSAKPQISKNVNSYQHFLKQPWMNADFVNWATNLRSISFQTGNKTESVPECYYKHTQTFDRKVKNKEKQNSIDNYVNYEHLLRRRIDYNQFSSNVAFQTGLRQPLSNSFNKDRKGTDTFSLLPRNLKTSYISNKFLKKVNIQKIQSSSNKTRNYMEDDFQSAFDGQHQYPSYSEKVIKEKNFNNYSHLAKGNCLPHLAWQTGLRHY